MINPYVGEITCFGFDFAPAGWIKCAGQLISVTEFSQLFAVIGTEFGGDGVADFGLPNFAPITEKGGQFCISAVGPAPTGGRNALPAETTIFPYPKAFPPGWIGCDGYPQRIDLYPALFKLLGTTFGGDGVKTFGIPQMLKAPPFDAPGDIGYSTYCIAENGSTNQGFMGEIKIFPAKVPPQGWLPCNGQLLSIQNNTALFSLLIVTYGGDGRTTFGLPNITGLPDGLQAFVCQLGVFPPHPPAGT